MDDTARIVFWMVVAAVSMSGVTLVLHGVSQRVCWMWKLGLGIYAVSVLVAVLGVFLLR